ncbi:hypothetical protein AWB76_02247 [Caballeronia temeraria]|uniref:REase AHJR-like domain-containing protein n=1 Tax=Caballeronia temeraria TaxID=1777137 RepID=A0A158AED5_9BURK|nr:hypothetical protein [Caballeronia temeraria]SAK56194.1 hypothetical protein AWB76_02247 [Caballeronia temeraria]
MNHKSSNRERQRIRDIADEYSKKGYRATVPRASSDLPEFLRAEGYLPDLILVSDHDGLIVSIKSSESLRSDAELARISDMINAQEGWQFLFILSNPRSRHLPIVGRKSASRWREYLEKSRYSVLQEPELVDAALLFAWASLEAIVRETLQRDETRGREESFESPLSQMRDAVILGLLSRDALPRLESIWQIRTCIVHAVDGPPASIADVNFLQDRVREVNELVESNRTQD